MPNPFRGPEHVLHYLARYSHRVAISNHRLLSIYGPSLFFSRAYVVRCDRR